jgi:hypothetical protein
MSSFHPKEEFMTVRQQSQPAAAERTEQGNTGAGATAREKERENEVAIAQGAAQP